MRRLPQNLTRIPCVIWMSLFAVLIVWLPSVQAALELDRAAVANGEAWRLLSGHWTHWNVEHLLWDVLMFASVGALCESRDRRATLWLIGISALVISVSFLVCYDGLTAYRGLSGIDSALFAMALVLLGHEQYQQGNGRGLALVCLGGAGFLGKITFETISGGTLFVDSAGAGFTPLPLVHLIGGICGVLASCWSIRRDGRSCGARHINSCGAGIPLHDL